MNQLTDQDSRATLASAEAKIALAAGDTDEARRKFRLAAQVLEAEMNQATDEETEQLLRFLAATQYYKGGHYPKALELAERIKAAKLPADTRHALPKFMQDVKARAAPGYQAGTQQKFQELWTAKDFAGILGVLAEHPYVRSRADLAFLRAVCCEELKDYRAAVHFFADAARWAPDSAEVLVALSPLPLTRLGEGNLSDAWDYVALQVELFPNAVSYALASLLCLGRARQAEGDALKAEWRGEQLRYLALAKEHYEHLPASFQQHAGITNVMTLAYEAAALALHRAGDQEAARRACQDALSVNPRSPTAWSMLGMVLASGKEGTSDEATTAMKKAIELGDKTYFPFYYLAYDALTHGEYKEAFDLAQEALKRGQRQDREVKSLLYQWAAISLIKLHEPDSLPGRYTEAEELFRKAIEVAPENELARENYRVFQTSRHFIASLPPTPPLAPFKLGQPLLQYPLPEIASKPNGDRYNPAFDLRSAEGARRMGVPVS